MADIEKLLQKTSRTFALSIPLLPLALRREVSLSYLLFRIADTIEDSTNLPIPMRQSHFDLLDSALLKKSYHSFKELTEISSSYSNLQHQGYSELMASLPTLLKHLSELHPRRRQLIINHLRRTIHGMSESISYPETPKTLQSLRDYCYIVAGIVGELLTELFIDHNPTTFLASELRTRSAAFGEGLQIVNIIKDQAVDNLEGRTFLPGDVRAKDIIELAREDLLSAADYISILRRRNEAPGTISFCTLPILLAWANLELLTEKRRESGKLNRQEVRFLASHASNNIDAIDILLQEHFRKDPITYLSEAIQSSL